MPIAVIEVLGVFADDDVVVGIDEDAGAALGGVVVLVGRQRLGQRGPGADVEPLHRHLDDRHLRLALVLARPAP